MMAGNKINTKTKGKEEKGKSNNKVITSQSNEEMEDPDFALLRKPIHTSVTGFGQARKIFDIATEELKTLLSDECDVLYECKVCRNIFRSLVNFISHKRVYCQEKFSSTVHGHFIKPSSTLNEIMKIKQLEKDYQESINNNNITEDTDSDRIPLTKDLTEVVEKLSNINGKEVSNNDVPQITMQEIPGSKVAVFQNVDENSDNMRSEVEELDKMLSKNVAVLQSDGKVLVQKSVQESGNVIQISDDEDDNVLKCKICNVQFSTQKTLKFHMKYKHVKTRLVYPCPDCLDIFATSWSVYRHLFRVHRRSTAQIRRMRESIQAKAFKMNNPPAFYAKRKNNMKSPPVQKITEEERIDQENQAWMNNMEGDGELPRCGGCGRTFERRAALSAHTHTCQPRSRALARRAPNDGKKIEIQIRKDYNKGPPSTITMPVRTIDLSDNKIGQEQKKTFILLPIEQKEKSPEKAPLTLDEEPMEVSEDDPGSSDANVSPQKQEKVEADSVEPVIHLPFAQQAETSNLIALKKKIQPDIDLEKILCKKCDTQLPSVQELYDHVAEHYKWMRYACKLCNFKHFYFDKLVEHVKIVHKLKGDKKFYSNTVAAIDGAEALEMAVDEVNVFAESSLDSRRQSRCSSDSSRLSDDSSSSSTRPEIGSKKRKLLHSKSYMKRKKECLENVRTEQKDEVIPTENGYDIPSSLKSFEENSSDMEDVDEKAAKRASTDDNTSVASRRSVRRKAKPKNEDFEYDLSNLLKKEAQGYRESQVVTNPKPCQPKKKSLPEITTSYDSINKDFCGSLITLSKKAAEKAAAHMKTINISLYNTQKEVRPTNNIFVKPMIPKTASKGEKVSPKKDEIENKKDNINNDDKFNVNADDKSVDLARAPVEETKTTSVENNTSPSTSQHVPGCKIINGSNLDTDLPKVKKINIPSVVPFKFRRQSLDLMKSPVINTNLSEFTKTGMKTKILVIKPINRKNDGNKPSHTPLKFQTIKLKDCHNTSSEDKSDQVVVVKVPKVKSIEKPVIENDMNTDISRNEQITPENSKSVKNTSTDSVPVPDSSEDKVVNMLEIKNDELPIENVVASETQHETILQLDSALNNIESDNPKEIKNNSDSVSNQSSDVTNSVSV